MDIRSDTCERSRAHIYLRAAQRNSVTLLRANHLRLPERPNTAMGEKCVYGFAYGVGLRGSPYSTVLYFAPSVQPNALRTLGVYAIYIYTLPLAPTTLLFFRRTLFPLAADATAPLLVLVKQKSERTIAVDAFRAPALIIDVRSIGDGCLFYFQCNCVKTVCLATSAWYFPFSLRGQHSPLLQYYSLIYTMPRV